MKHARKNIYFTTLATSTDDERTTFLDRWVALMTDERDNETGPNAVDWLLFNEQTFAPRGLHRTIIGWLDGEPVVTLTITPDDHGVGTKNSLGQLAMIGLCNTHWDHRNHGLMDIIMDVACDEVIQPWVNENPPEEGKSHRVCFFTWPQDVRPENYMRNSGTKHGFVELPDIRVGDETIWERHFVPMAA